MGNRSKILTATALAVLLTTSFLMTLATIPKTVSAFAVHDPVFIEGDADFTAANGVTGGSGTASDPYIIEGWEIDATTVNGIQIGDTSAHFTIRDCYVHDGGSTYSGIYLLCCSNGTVTGNTCSNNRYGIRLTNSDDNTLSGNNCSSNIYTGIHLSYSSSNTLSGNDCNSNTYGGIHLYSSSNNTLSGGNCSGNGYGIEFVYSSSNTLSGSNCSSNNEYGICLSSSSDNTLGKNNVSSNGLYGIILWDSTWTTVYHNIFFDNVVNHAYDDRGSENLWNASYPIGGNYWDNYTGVDEYSGPGQDQFGPDGIGDTPYEIDADSFDHYPLMEPEITVEEEEEEQEEDGKGLLEPYGLPLGIVIALAVIALVLFFVLRGRKGGKAPAGLEEPPSTEPENHD